MKLPKLRRNKSPSGKFVGNWWIPDPNGGPRINLGTQDAKVARENARAALKNGKRDFTPDDQAAAAATVDALDHVDDPPPPAPTPPPAPAPPTLALVPQDAPPADAPPADAPPSPKPAGDWAADANAAAASSAADDQADGEIPAEEPRPKLSELPFLQTAIVSASKLAVYVQVAIQSWAARRFFKLELPPLDDPAKAPKTIEEFSALLSSPWPTTDPREPGRQVYEAIVRRMIPEDMPIPDWALAPALVAAFTLMAQIPHARRVRTDGQPEEAQPAEARAAA